MNTLFPPVLEAKAQAIPYAEQISLENKFLIEFKMPDVNPGPGEKGIRNVQVSLKYQSTNESAVNRNKSPDGNVLYIRADSESQYFYRKTSGNYVIAVPYLCFDGGRPQEGVTYCVQVRFGSGDLWTEGSGISDQDFGGFAAWRSRQVSAVPSLFGEWSNVQTVYCYGSAAVSLTANYNDFVPELEYRYAPVLDDPLEQIKIVYQYSDLYGSTFNTLVFNGQRQQDGVYTLKVKLPITAVQTIFVSLEAVTKNNTIRGRTLTIVPLKFNKIFPIFPHQLDEDNKEIPLLEDITLMGEEAEDGCLAKKVILPKEKVDEGNLIPDGFDLKEGSTISIYRANIYSLETVKIVEGLAAERGASTIFKDYSVEMGEEYQYIAALKDADGKVYALVQDIYDWGYDNPGYGRLMRMNSVFLTTRKHQLRLQGNVQISGLKRNTSDNFQTTLGSQYPYYQRNAKMNYRTFTLNGLITASHDPTGSFLRNDNENGLWWDDDNGSRLAIINRDLYSTKQFSISRQRMKDLISKGEEVKPLDSYQKEEIFDNPRLKKEYSDYYQGQFGPMSFYDEFLYRDIVRQVSTDQTDENIYYERKFREFVMLWLSDGKPKLFRSETEGNMIVMISGASFSPQDKSGRMVYNLSCTVTEIAEYNLQNLLDYNLIPFDFQTSLITALPRNLRYGDKIDPRDYTSIIALGENFDKYFTLDISSGTYIVNTGADLDALNNAINNVNEYTFIRGDEDPYVYSGLVYQYNKIYNIPDCLAGVRIKPINTLPAVKGGSGVGNYYFSVPLLDGTNMLPDGLYIDPDTGVIDGTPILTGDTPTKPRTVVLNVFDKGSTNPIPQKRQAAMTISIGTVYPELRFVDEEMRKPKPGEEEIYPTFKLGIGTEKVGTNIKPVNLGDAVIGGYPFTAADSGAGFPYVWEAEDLPQGFSINNFGVITGAFSDQIDQGKAIIKISDAAGQTIKAYIEFGNGYLPIYFYPSVKFNIPYSEQDIPIKEIDVSSGVSGGVPKPDKNSYTHGYKFTAEGLPAGIYIDEFTGIIQGAPEKPGNAVTATITAQDFDNPPSSASITILVQSQLEKFEFINWSAYNINGEHMMNNPDYDPKDPESPEMIPEDLMLGTAIDSMQIKIQGDLDLTTENPDDRYDYQSADVHGGLRYLDPPYYRFSAEYLLPDFEVSNKGVISGRTQVGTDKWRKAIIKVFDARNEVRYAEILVPRIKTQMTFKPSATYALPDTFVKSSKEDYKVKIPLSDIQMGNPPFTIESANCPDGMYVHIGQDGTSQKEYILIEHEPKLTEWPTNSKAAGFITITVTDTPEHASDQPEKITIKVPFGTIVPELTWNQADVTLPVLNFGQTKKLYFSNVEGGVYPYTVKVLEGKLDPWKIVQDEMGEQNANFIYFSGTGEGKQDADSVLIQLTDGIGQTREVRFTKSQNNDQLTFSLENSFGNYNLIVNRSQVPGVHQPQPMVVIRGHGGDGDYTYGTTNPNNEIIPGLVVDPKTGVISGSPTKVDNSADLTGHFTLKDGSGNSGVHNGASRWLSPVVSEVPKYLDGISDPYTEQNLVINQGYNKKFFQPNTNRNLEFILDGELPAGLTLRSDGSIYGTCTAITDRKEVTVTARIKADDFNLQPVELPLRIIFPAVAGYLEYTVLPPGFSLNTLQKGVDIGRVKVSEGRKGGTAPFTWDLGGDIPPGIRIEQNEDGTVAELVGIPTEIRDTGGSLQVIVTDAAGQTRTGIITWPAIYAELIFPDSDQLDIPEYEAFTDITPINVPQTVKITGGSGSFRFSDGGTLFPYSITGEGIISGNSGSAARPEKNGTITVTDTKTGVQKSITVKVGKINGIMTFDKSKVSNIPEGVISTAIQPLDLRPGVVGGTTPVFSIVSLPQGWPIGSLTINQDTGIITGTRPSKNAPPGQLSINLKDAASEVVNISITIEVGAVSGEKLSYTPDSSVRAIPSGTRNTSGTVDLGPGFTGLADPIFTVITPPTGWNADNFSFSKAAVLTYRRPNGEFAAGELKARVEERASQQSIEFTIPVGAVT